MRLFEGTEFDIPPRCDRCGKLDEECRCPPPPPARIPPHEQLARIGVQRRKHGRIVTVVSGLEEDGNDLPGLLTLLKDTCGAGGTLKDGALEIQGDHVNAVEQQLKSLGFRVGPRR